MLAIIMEAVIFWGVFFGVLATGLLLGNGLAWIVGTVKENKRKKEWANRYYNRH